MLDFGDVVVHVMSEEQRNFYDMESFYGAAEEVCIISLHAQFSLLILIILPRIIFEMVHFAQITFDSVYFTQVKTGQAERPAFLQRSIWLSFTQWTGTAQLA